MPSARELLEQADALMRRNRARAVDTEIPELTEVVAEVAPAPDATLIALEDVPELVDRSRRSRSRRSSSCRTTSTKLRNGLRTIPMI